MTRGAAPLLVFLVVGATGCDSASVYEDCTKEAKVGTGEERCFPSTFPKEDERARETAGFVSIGLERVPNALVVVDGEPTTTDAGGFYRRLYTPFRYDVSARVENDVVAFHQAALRFLDLAVERDGAPRAFAAKVVLQVKDAPRPGHRLAVFVEGENVAGLSGSLGEGFTVLTRTYDNDKAKLHVVEYPEGGDIAAAVAKGKVDVPVRADTTTTATVTLDPITERKETQLRANPDPPPGFVVSDIELVVDFGTRQNRAVVRTVKLGEKIDLPVIEGANWVARATATRADGAVASIGLRPFAPGDTTDLAFYPPPEAVRNDGNVLIAARAQAVGVFEHLLVPTGGGASIHLFSGTFDAKVPDLVRLGLPPARGEYRWTVRVFPDFAFVEAMSGVDNRLYRSSSTSSPRTIVLP